MRNSQDDRPSQGPNEVAGVVTRKRGPLADISNTAGPGATKPVAKRSKAEPRAEKDAAQQYQHDSTVQRPEAPAIPLAPAAAPLPPVLAGASNEAAAAPAAAPLEATNLALFVNRTVEVASSGGERLAYVIHVPGVASEPLWLVDLAAPAAAANDNVSVSIRHVSYAAFEDEVHAGRITLAQHPTDGAASGTAARALPMAAALLDRHLSVAWSNGKMYDAVAMFNPLANQVWIIFLKLTSTGRHRYVLLNLEDTIRWMNDHRVSLAAANPLAVGSSSVPASAAAAGSTPAAAAAAAAPQLARGAIQQLAAPAAPSGNAEPSQLLQSAQLAAVQSKPQHTTPADDCGAAVHNGSAASGGGAPAHILGSLNHPADEASALQRLLQRAAPRSPQAQLDASGSQRADAIKMRRPSLRQSPLLLGVSPRSGGIQSALALLEEAPAAAPASAIRANDPQQMLLLNAALAGGISSGASAAAAAAPLTLAERFPPITTGAGTAPPARREASATPADAELCVPSGEAPPGSALAAVPGIPVPIIATNNDNNTTNSRGASRGLRSFGSAVNLKAASGGHCAREKAAEGGTKGASVTVSLLAATAATNGQENEAFSEAVSEGNSQDCAMSGESDGDGLPSEEVMLQRTEALATAEADKRRLEAQVAALKARAQTAEGRGAALAAQCAALTAERDDLAARLQSAERHLLQAKGQVAELQSLSEAQAGEVAALGAKNAALRASVVRAKGTLKKVSGVLFRGQPAPSTACSAEAQ